MIQTHFAGADDTITLLGRTTESIIVDEPKQETDSHHDDHHDMGGMGGMGGMPGMGGMGGMPGMM